MACNMCRRGAYRPVSLLTRERRTVSGSFPYFFASAAAKSTWLMPFRLRAATILSPTTFARCFVLNMWEGFYTGNLLVSSLALAKAKLSRETSGVTKSEKRALKEWLTSVMPEGMSRNDIADELGVTRRTISWMLNPKAEAFPGLTMLRYLQLAGAVIEAPMESPASSRLAALEGQVAESIRLTKRALALLGDQQEPATPQAPELPTGTDDQ